MKSSCVGCSGHPDCLGVQTRSVFKVVSSPCRMKIPRGTPSESIAGHRCPFQTCINSSLLKKKRIKPMDRVNSAKPASTVLAEEGPHTKEGPNPKSRIVNPNKLWCSGCRVERYSEASSCKVAEHIARI